jgi:large subunit ribosomal protein L4
MAETKNTTLDKAVFGVEVKNHELLKQAYNAYLANSRLANATTLKRGEVRGGGKKPWKQKGTGRARFGSTRNPIWRHGGVAFGPNGEQNFTLKLSQTSKKVAVKQALSLANTEKKITVIETFACPKGKTTETVAMLAANKLATDKNTLLVVSEKDDLVNRATRNLAKLKAVRPTYLNVFDILNADQVVISQKSLPLIAEWLNGKEAK